MPIGVSNRLDSMMRRLVLLVVLSLMLGCGKSTAPTAHLAGTVTIKGEPIPADTDAALSFESLGGGKPVSAKIVNGRYETSEAPQGSVLVRFYISQPVGPKKISERTGQEYQDIANIVPPEHAAGMTIEVSGENLNQDFQL